MKARKNWLIILATICLCLVIGVVLMMRSSGNDPEDGTVVSGENIVYTSNVNKYSVAIEPPHWFRISSENYAIVEVGDLVSEHTFNEYVDHLEGTAEVKYRIYDFEMIYLYNGSELTWDEKSEFLLFENLDDIKVKKGDVLFISGYSTEFSNYDCFRVESDGYDNSQYIRIKNGCAEFNDYMLKKSPFLNISWVNKSIDGHSEYNTDSNIKSFPKKKLYGAVTVEEIIEYFDSVEKLCKEWIAWRKSLTNVYV